MMSPETKENQITSHMSSQKRLWWALGLGVLYVVLVFLGGLVSGSLTLIADSAHMLAHSMALAIALAAAFFAQRTRHKKHSSDYQRIETLGAYTNGLLLMLIAGTIAYESFEVIALSHEGDVDHGHGHGHHVDAGLMGVIAVIGLFLHGLSAAILYGGRKESLNVYALYLHIFFDVAATVVALVTSVIINFTEMTVLDGYSSLIVSSLIFYSAYRMLKRSMRLLIGQVPENIVPDDVIAASIKIDHVVDIHHLVIQPRQSGRIALSAHVVLGHDCVSKDHWKSCQKKLEQLYRDKFSIDEILLQIEFEAHKQDH